MSQQALSLDVDFAQPMVPDAFSASFDWSRYAPPTVVAHRLIHHAPQYSPWRLALACFHMGWTVLWLFWGMWLAALWLGITSAMARTAYSLTTAYVVGGAGWAAFATISAIHLITRR